MKKRATTLAVCLFLTGAGGVASASVATVASGNLIENGSFDKDLSWWFIDGSTPPTWDSGTVHLGSADTQGISIFSQEFDPYLATSLMISFDYEWQSPVPESTDTFSVNLNYTYGTTTWSTRLFSQTSTESDIGTTVSFSDTITLLPLCPSIPHGYELAFSLNEATPENGSEVKIDNVEVNAVPLPAAGWLLGASLVGLLGLRNRKRR